MEGVESCDVRQEESGSNVRAWRKVRWLEYTEQGWTAWVWRCDQGPSPWRLFSHSKKYVFILEPMRRVGGILISYIINLVFQKNIPSYTQSVGCQGEKVMQTSWTFSVQLLVAWPRGGRMRWWWFPKSDWIQETWSGKRTGRLLQYWWGAHVEV